MSSSPLSVPLFLFLLLLSSLFSLSLSQSSSTGAPSQPTATAPASTTGLGLTSAPALGPYSILPLPFSPYGVVYDGGAFLYASNTGNSSVSQLTLQGSITRNYYSFNPPLFLSRGLAIDSAGLLYVCDQLNSKLVKFAPNGTQLALFTGAESFPYGVAIDAQSNIWVANQGGDQALELSPSGAVVYTTPQGTLHSPQGICIDPVSGAVYVASTAVNVVIKRAANGFLSTFYSTGLNQPNGCVVDYQGNVFLADTNNNRVIEIAANGTQVATFVTTGTLLQFPTGLTLDYMGNLYVADSGNNRIVVFNHATAPKPPPMSSSSAAPAPSSSVVATSAPAPVTGPTPQQLLFLFSTLQDDALALSINAAETVAYVGTFNGAIYAIPLPVAANAVLPPPLYSNPHAVWQGLVVDPTSTLLYLLDSRSAALYTLSLTNGTITTLCSFTSESTASLTALAMDFTATPHPVAYLASQTTSAVYAVDVSQAGQSQSTFQALYTDAQGLIFTGLTIAHTPNSPSTLYLTSATVSQGAANTVLSTLTVTGTILLTSTGAVVPVYSSDAWDWPDAVIVNAAQTVAYVLDGGYDHGYVTTIAPLEICSIFAVNLTAPHTTTTLFRSNSTFLRGGLQLTQDQSTLVFLASDRLEELVLFPGLVTRSLTGPAVVSSTGAVAVSSSVKPAVSSSAAPTSAAPTSPAPTSAAPTSAAPTSAAPTSAAPTSAAPTSAAPTSAAPTSAAPTSAAPTSAAPTSAAPTSAAPTSAAPTSAAPTSAAPTSAAPTSAAPTSAAPTSAAPTSAAPTSASPTSAAPTSATPTSATPTSAAPTSAAPTSAAPTSAAPTSASPTSAAPTSAALPSPTSAPVASLNITVGLAGPFGIVYDGLGHLYVSLTDGNTIVQLSTSGQLLYTFPALSPPLSQPRDLAIDPSGSLYVADSMNNRIVKLSPNGTVLQVFTSNPSLYQPWGVTIRASDSHVFVDDTYNSRVVEFYPNGTVASTLDLISANLAYPVGLSFDPQGRLYIAAYGNAQIVRVVHGQVQQFYAGSLDGPFGVTVDAYGTVWVADTYNNRVVEVSPAGVFVQQLTTSQPSLNTPCSITFDDQGSLYLTDFKNNRIVEFPRVSVAPLVSSPSSPVVHAASSSTAAVPVQVTSSARFSSSHASSSVARVSSSSSSIPSNVLQGSLCFIAYGLEGNIDYPWSVATRVSFLYSATDVPSTNGLAVHLVSGSGTRVYTNKFGAQLARPVTIASTTGNLLYLNSSIPVDTTGLTLNLSTPTQLPGVGPSTLFTSIALRNSSGLINESLSAQIDPQAEAFVSTIPGSTTFALAQRTSTRSLSTTPPVLLVSPSPMDSGRLLSRRRRMVPRICITRTM